MTSVDRPSDEETLSQLMDGEWHDIDRGACVAALCADDGLKAAWGRWHLVRDALRGEAVAPAPASLAARVAAADRKSTRLNSSHFTQSRMPSSA